MLLPIEPIAVAESPVLATALEVEPEPVAILPAWPLTLEAEVRLFRQWKGYSLAQRTSQTQSWIWSFGIEIQDSTSRRWVCGPCLTAKVPKPTSYISEGTQNCEKHLWEKHGRWDTSGKRPKPSNKRGSKRKHGNIAGFMNLDLADPKDQAVANRLIKGFDRSHFQRLIVNWIVDSQLSFRAVENPRLRAVFEYLNPAVTIQQAHISRHTLRRRTIELYNIHLFTVKKALRQCPGQIHLAFDGARTRNRHALFGITAALGLGCRWRTQLDDSSSKLKRCLQPRLYQIVDASFGYSPVPSTSNGNVELGACPAQVHTLFLDPALCRLVHRSSRVLRAPGLRPLSTTDLPLLETQQDYGTGPQAISSFKASAVCMLLPMPRCILCRKTW
ncbi:restless-like transposase [Apiospora marii]|uniref:Restless-like transposase n=1 Tax=Apiospora marii TaxID=335849 RepID=A0ABR1RKH9_9PEZI